MSEVRPFVRHDRDGLTALANRHIAAVLPGGAVPVATLLSQMERDSAEVVIDPWVVDRHTIVGIHADRVVAAAHLKRYGADDRVGPAFRGAGVIDWMICDPDRLSAGSDVMAAALVHLARWDARIWYGDGSLPCLGVYGVPDAWPHVERLFRDAGFTDDGGQIEVVFAGDLADVPVPGPPPIDGLRLERIVGTMGTSFNAVLGEETVGVFEVEDTHGLSNAQLTRWADEANHHVARDHRGNGIGPWLFAHGCAWLRLGGKTRLLTYAVERRAEGQEPMEGTAEEWAGYYSRFGLQPVTRTRRGWKRQPARIDDPR